MKNIMRFAIILTLFALAGCDGIAPVEPVESPKEKPQFEKNPASSSGSVQQATDSIIFTASLGAQSKTYLEHSGSGYKTRWADKDVILLWDAACFNEATPQNFEFCTLSNGAGTSVAEFPGTLQADTYVALYGDAFDYPVDGLPVVFLPQDQYLWQRNGNWNFGDYAYPMAAVSDGRNFEFQNLCSILKVSITGDGQMLNGVTVAAANGEPMVGSAIVYQDGADFRLRFLDDNASSYVKFWGEVNLSSEPVDCFIVVPAQTYEGGFNISVVSDCGTMELSTGSPLTTERSRYYDISIDFDPLTISDLLGTYTATGENYWDGPCQWKITLYEDAVDGHKVWFDNLFQKDGWASSDTRYYGIVSDDMRTISIPFGQTSEYLYSNGKPLTLLGFDGVETAFDTGAVDAQVIIEGADITIDFGDEYGFWAWIEDVGNLNILNPGIVAVKD